MKTILYLHTGAELYGADIILLTLIKGLDKSKYKPIVVLPSDGPLIKKLNPRDFITGIFCILPKGVDKIRKKEW